MTIILIVWMLNPIVSLTIGQILRRKCVDEKAEMFDKEIMVTRGDRYLFKTASVYYDYFYVKPDDPNADLLNFKLWKLVLKKR